MINPSNSIQNGELRGKTQSNLIIVHDILSLRDATEMKAERH